MLLRIIVASSIERPLRVIVLIVSECRILVSIGFIFMLSLAVVDVVFFATGKDLAFFLSVERIVMIGIVSSMILVISTVFGSTIVSLPFSLITIPFFVALLTISRSMTFLLTFEANYFSLLPSFSVLVGFMIVPFIDHSFVILRTVASCMTLLMAFEAGSRAIALRSGSILIYLMSISFTFVCFFYHSLIFSRTIFCNMAFFLAFKAHSSFSFRSLGLHLLIVLMIFSFIVVIWTISGHMSFLLAFEANSSLSFSSLGLSFLIVLISFLVIGIFIWTILGKVPFLMAFIASP